MANNFKPWVDSPREGQQVQSASAFADDTQRINGFKAGDPASALLVNSALRQANIVVAGLMQMCDDVKTLPDGLSLMSTVTQIKNAIKAAIDQLDAAVLASAKSYADTKEGVTDEKITSIQNQVTSNKNRLDTLEPRVDNLEDDVAQNLLDVQTALENITNGTTVVAKATNAEYAKSADNATNAEHAENAKSADTAIDADTATNAEKTKKIDWEILYSNTLGIDIGKITLNKAIADGDLIRVCFGGEYRYFQVKTLASQIPAGWNAFQLSITAVTPNSTNGVNISMNTASFTCTVNSTTANVTNAYATTIEIGSNGTTSGHFTKITHDEYTLLPAVTEIARLRA